MFNFQIRLVVEESLNQLPFSKCVVTTPTGAKYQGLKYQKGNCGVSIVRSGEAMEQVLYMSDQHRFLHKLQQEE
jgi:Uracil phosphoribosyltransferase